MKTAISITISEEQMEWISETISRTNQTRSQIINKCIRACMKKQEMARSKEERIICPECKSPETIRNGTEKQRNGKIQKYKCKECGHVFNEKQIINK